MNKLNCSITNIYIYITIGSIFTVFTILISTFIITKNLLAVKIGLIISVALFLWAYILIRCLQKFFTSFTDDICITIDSMLNENVKPTIIGAIQEENGKPQILDRTLDEKDMPYAMKEKDTLSARIHYRLLRVYEVLDHHRLSLQQEKAELQTLISDISHQVKTPIANLKIMNATLLQPNLSDAHKQKYLAATTLQLNKLEFLMNALVKTSRLEIGIITLKKSNCYVQELLAEIVGSVIALAEGKKITILTECHEELKVMVDRKWTVEAIFNVLENAVKYTPLKGNITITVKKLELYTQITITDDGIGIDEKEHGTIFKRFYRSEKVHGTQGVGIGLYLTRKIISLQGGYLKVISQIGQGSSFSIFLPN